MLAIEEDSCNRGVPTLKLFLCPVNCVAVWLRLRAQSLLTYAETRPLEQKVWQDELEWVVGQRLQVYEDPENEGAHQARQPMGRNKVAMS